MRIRSVGFAFALLCAMSASAIAQKTTSQIQSEITTLFPDNSVGSITPARLRTVTNDLAISYLNVFIPQNNLYIGNASGVAVPVLLGPSCVVATSILNCGLQPISNNQLLANTSGISAVPGGQQLIDALVSNSAAIQSTKLQFLSLLSGAVARTVQSKEADIVSVKDFGATGDGTTDDSTAIQAAVSATASGKILYFPAGTYIFCGTMDFGTKFHVFIRGDDGPTALIKQKNSCNSAAMVNFGDGTTFIEDVGVQNLTFDANVANNSTTGVVINFNGVSFPRVQNSRFSNFKTAAIKADSTGGTVASFPIISGNVIGGVIGTSTDCIYIGANSFGGYINSNILRTCGNLVHIVTGGEMAVVGNDFDEGDQGLFIDGGTRVRASGNAFLNQQHTAVVISGNTNTFTGNGITNSGIATNNTYYGIQITGTNNSVTGNQISNFSNTMLAGIAETGAANLNSFCGNNIANATTPITIIGGSSTNCSTGGGGSPGGSTTQVQFNSAGSFAGSANLTWVSPALSIGASGATGQLKILGTSSGTLTQTVQSAASTPTVTWGTASGTPAVTASSPLAITTATGNITCATCGVTGSPLSQFAATTSAQLAGVISDETGSGALVFGTSPTIASPALSGTVTGNNTIPLTILKDQIADTVVMNATGLTGPPSAVAINNCAVALTYDTSTHTFGCNSGVGTGTVTSITPGNGLTSTLTATAPGSAITSTGTLSGAHLVNAQTGTSYAILDSDRAKLITAVNAAAQAYSIAQAGNSSAFQAGWFVDLKNNSTNVNGVVTLTPATSTINGASTLKVQPGQSVRIVSDGTNYQATFAGSAAQLPGTTTNDSANSGNIGEYQTTFTSGASLTSGNPANAGTISLTAGDWDVWIQGVYVPAASTTTSFAQWSISSTSATINNGITYWLALPFTTGAQQTMPTLLGRMSLSTTTTVYCVAQFNFAVSTATANCSLFARRVR